ncbi:hypothetical protein, variant [Gaeumannomyces tritici R3-111a-1]|uniref:Uncharacterized protein n=1 Tax=Gaeumannomyces tritici (strain R3-111a-1) TaxID=644352 RepID=J3NU90_GAET3|nr:hypothetical protein GGTG_04845 [Gaeumannomyces tritici R3-111a-1]XP_009220907.1 hypothetical protein, variant [Gaeumannomyces tritici R3-111a-1]EJT79761.1 hypothetical protein, variant [Gaeumannomyces tritici R3-111a-1]EJT79762.1 hypothetical protein GGTG_04845 [Gaeumannomyces tritici R3-111a-1]
MLWERRAPSSRPSKTKSTRSTWISWTKCAWSRSTLPVRALTGIIDKLVEARRQHIIRNLMTRESKSLLVYFIDNFRWSAYDKWEMHPRRLDGRQQRPGGWPFNQARPEAVRQLGCPWRAQGNPLIIIPVGSRAGLEGRIRRRGKGLIVGGARAWICTKVSVVER